MHWAQEESRQKQPLSRAKVTGVPFVCSCRHDPFARDDEEFECANNCEFYGRRDEYIRAKKQLVASLR